MLTAIIVSFIKAIKKDHRMRAILFATNCTSVMIIILKMAFSSPLDVLREKLDCFMSRRLTESWVCSLSMEKRLLMNNLFLTP